MMNKPVFNLSEWRETLEVLISKVESDKLPKDALLGSLRVIAEHFIYSMEFAEDKQKQFEQLQEKYEKLLKVKGFSERNLFGLN